MSLGVGLTRFRSRIHRAGRKVKLAIGQLVGSSSKDSRNKKDTAQQNEKETVSLQHEYPRTHPSSSDDSSAPYISASSHDSRCCLNGPSLEISPYEKVAHQLCQALVDHIREHYPQVASPACSRRSWSSFGCDPCSSPPNSSKTHVTSMTSVDLENADITAPSECYDSRNRSAQRQERRHKKSTSAGRILSSELPTAQQPPIEQTIPQSSTLCNQYTSPDRTVSWHPPTQSPSIAGHCHPDIKVQNNPVEHIRGLLPRRPLPDPHSLDRRVFSWLDDVPEQQHPLRRKLKMDDMSSRDGYGGSGLGIIT